MLHFDCLPGHSTVNATCRPDGQWQISDECPAEVEEECEKVMCGAWECNQLIHVCLLGLVLATFVPYLVCGLTESCCIAVGSG